MIGQVRPLTQNRKVDMPHYYACTRLILVGTLVGMIFSRGQCVCPKGKAVALATLGRNIVLTSRKFRRSRPSDIPSRSAL